MRRISRRESVFVGTVSVAAGHRGTKHARNRVVDHFSHPWLSLARPSSLGRNASSPPKIKSAVHPGRNNRAPMDDQDRGTARAALARQVLGRMTMWKASWSGRGTSCSTARFLHPDRCENRPRELGGDILAPSDPTHARLQSTLRPRFPTSDRRHLHICKT